MSTFKNPPWMINYLRLKYKIRCKNNLHLKYLKHGNCDYNELQRFIEEVSVNTSKSKKQHDRLARKLAK